jgi:hypothetical protein
MSIGLVNGLQTGLERGLSLGVSSGVDAGLYDGMYGEISDRFVYDLPKCSFWLDPSYGLNVQNLAGISSWKDRFNKYEYGQSTVSVQPRLIIQDSNFNNNAIIDFNTTGRGLFTKNGPLISGNSTLVVVYQYLSVAAGSSYQSRVFSNGDEQSARSLGIGYLWNKNNNSNLINSAGYHGNGNTNPLTTSSSLFNTNRYIIVMNRNLWLANNNTVTITNGSLSNIPTFRLNAIGGSTVALSGVFKLGEVLLYDYVMNSEEASFISNRLNSKYLIY